MNQLNSICENILKYITDNVDANLIIHPQVIYDNFKQQYPHRLILSALKELAEKSYIILTNDYTGEIFRIQLTSAGEFYFINLKEASQSQQPMYNIVNSPGVTIGNNNSVSFNNGVDFSEALAIVETMDSTNKKTFSELISIIQDCLENSKPLPKSKLEKTIKMTSDIFPIASAIGSVLIKFLSQ